MLRGLIVFALGTLAASGAGHFNYRPYAEQCVAYYGRRYGIEPAFVRAIISVESAWYPGAVSDKGAVGLMQLMPGTARDLGAAHPYWIHENIEGGIRYLASLSREFHGDQRLILAAYHAGPFWVGRRQLNYSHQGVYRYILAVRRAYHIEKARERNHP